MSGLNSSSTTDFLVTLLFGAVCLGPLITLYLLRLWLDIKPLQTQRIARVEYKINRIATHLGIEDLGDSNPILRELWKGNKINAIKLYKEQTGVGLKEAKEAIDALERGEIVTLERGDATA